MRSWLGSSLLSMALLAAGCADSPVNTKAPFGSGATGVPNPMNPNTGGQQPGNSTGTQTDMDASAGSNLDGGPETEDAGSDGAALAGLCNVAIDATRGFHCTYINRIASAILVPPDSGLEQIKGCKDFPADVSEADATAACDKLVPALDGSIVVAAGACETTGAVGYCSDAFGGRDFAYHADCEVANMAAGSGSWACDKVVPNEAGWTCVGDASKDWDRGCGESAPDSGAPEGDSGPAATCDDLPTGDGKTYRCTYTNDFASAPGCKQYTGTWTKAAATSDCNGLIQAKDGTAVFAEGACAETGSVGYCLNTRGDREYAYSGDCSNTNGSGKWACDNFGIVGQDASCASFVCASNEPDRKCTYASPAAGKPSCVELPFDTSAAEAATLCNGGTAGEGKCGLTGAVATCELASGSLEVYTTGLCFEHRATCKGPSVFACLVEEPVYSCHKTDNGFGCRTLPGNYTCNWCVDYPQSEGWTQAAAAARCTADTANPNGGTANVVSVSKSTTAESCGATREEPTRCVVPVDGKDTLRYGETSCSGTSEPVPPKCDLAASPVYTCNYDNSFSGDGACREFKACSEAEATQLCEVDSLGAQADPGTLGKGSCTQSGAIGKCNLDDGSVDYVYGGNCNSGQFTNKWGCEDQAGGSFVCLTP